MSKWRRRKGTYSGEEGGLSRSEPNATTATTAATEGEGRKTAPCNARPSSSIPLGGAAESAIVDGAVTRGWRHEQAGTREGRLLRRAGEGGETLTYAQRNSRPQLAQRMLQIGIDWRRGGGRLAVRDGEKWDGTDITPTTNRKKRLDVSRISLPPSLVP